MKNKRNRNRFIIICTLCCIVCVFVGAVSAAVSISGKPKDKPVNANTDATMSDVISKVENKIDKVLNGQDTSSALSGKKIIVDAGHGGSDSGTIGVSTGVYEKDINLKISYKLKEKLEKLGAQVIMTRTNENTAELGTTKKLQISERGKLIEQSNADMFLSIHQNSNEDSSCKGPQILYYDDKSEKLAKDMQNIFNNELNTKRNTLKNNYYVLKYGNQPSVIVECGFLSTPEEEKLLQTDEYQEKLLKILVESVKTYFK